MTALAEPLSRSAGVLYSACGGIWVMMMHAPPVAADMLAARPSLLAMSERFPGGFPTLTWVMPGAGFSMDAEARKLASKITVEFNALILAQATLIEGTGFQAAAVRAIIAGIDMMTRSTAPKKTFDRLRPSVDWCLTLRPPPADATAAAICAALEAARKPLG